MDNELDNLLNELNNKNLAFNEEPKQETDETVVPVEKETATEPSVEEPKGEVKEPFHKNIKFKKLVEENKEMKKQIEQILASQNTKTPESRQESEDKITDILTRMIGNDSAEKVALIKEFRGVFDEIAKKGAEEGYKMTKTEFLEQQRAEKEAEQQLQNAFNEIEETYNVDLSSDAPTARKQKNDFINFIQKIAPKNEFGEITEYPDLVQSFSIFNEMHSGASKTNQRAKDIASRSVSRASTTSQTPKRVSWSNIDKLLGL